MSMLEPRVTPAATLRGESSYARPVSRASIDAALAACHARAAAAWPGVAIDVHRFARAVTERQGGDDRRAIPALFTDDLYLACGCAAGDPAALAAFEHHCGPAIGRAIASTGASAADRADLGQIVRERLLVAPAGGVPRIATYSARGPLRAWVRVVATRETARLLPRVHRDAAASDDELEGVLAGGDDPRIDHLKRLYRDAFKRAFQAAVDALDDRDRLVLRQHTLDRLGIDQLAGLHGIHRATAARWVQSARDGVLARTHRELLRTLRLTRGELASVMRLIHSRLDVSLERVLRV